MNSDTKVQNFIREKIIETDFSDENSVYTALKELNLLERTGTFSKDEVKSIRKTLLFFNAFPAGDYLSKVIGKIVDNDSDVENVSIALDTFSSMIMLQTFTDACEVIGIGISLMRVENRESESRTCSVTLYRVRRNVYETYNRIPQ